MVYTIEQDEVMRARTKSLSQQKPRIIVEPTIKPKRKKRGRRKKDYSKKVLKGIKRMEGQVTSIFKDVPSNVVGLRRKPKIIKREKGLSDLGIVHDTRSNQEILNDFLS
jgi:hypothetical protein